MSEFSQRLYGAMAAKGERIEDLGPELVGRRVTGVMQFEDELKLELDDGSIVRIDRDLAVYVSSERPTPHD